LLAHHDDEVFCAGRLRRALAAGADIRLLWVTAGGLAPARLRIAEGARALRALGLPAGAGRDLTLPDQRAVEHIAEVATELVRLVDAATVPAGDGRRAEPPGEHREPATVYVAAYEGGHPDHDAVNAAAALAAGQRPGLRVVEYPLYRRGPFGLSVQAPTPAAGTAPVGYDVLRLTAADLALRRGLARANSSQLAPSLLPLLALARLAGRGRAEPARPLPAHDYTRPPHGGRLLYELYTPWRFARWTTALPDEARGPRDAAPAASG
jgi:LmbE family N-acetylglucosaminyl deacetylase